MKNIETWYIIDARREVLSMVREKLSFAGLPMIFSIRKTSLNGCEIAVKLRSDGTPRITLFRCYDKAGQLIFHSERAFERARKSLARIGRADPRKITYTDRCVFWLTRSFVHHEKMLNIGARRVHASSVDLHVLELMKRTNSGFKHYAL